jgi:hypothetical protein
MKKLSIFFIVFTLFSLAILIQPFLKADFSSVNDITPNSERYLVYGQSCSSTCSDECTYYGQRTCSDSTHYRACGNYDCDTCLEWSSAASCLSGTVCQNGTCVTSCTTHSSKSCYDSDVYWYNSCSVKEDKSTECGDSGWSNDYQCSGSNLQRKWLDKGCSGSACFSNSSWITSQDCGSDSWTNNYRCSGTQIQREKNKKGCSGSACYNYNEWVTEYNCANDGKTCSNGQCVPTCPSCSTDECSYIGQKTCSNNTSYKTCGNYDCDTCLEWSSSTNCGLGQVCQNGNCVIECTTHSSKSCYDSDVYWYNSCSVREDKYDECGSDSWTDNYQCSGNTIQRQKTIRGCSGAACTTQNQWENYQDCSATGKTCSNGQCITTCQCGDWGSWSNQGCSQGGCSSGQMYQTRTRTCNPSGCNTQSESKCIADSSCDQPTCQNECAISGQTTCNDNGSRKICGNYDSDSCLEWSSPESCGNDTCNGSTRRDYSCSGGTCSYNDSTCSSQCYSCGNGVCNSECGENQNNCSQDCGQSCQNECAISGQVRCSGSSYKQTCGNYDSDSCLEWSSVESILGPTYCGYGSCNDNQKPSWYCTGGIAEYTCNNDSSCGCNSCNDCNNNNCGNNCNNNCNYINHDHKLCYNSDSYWYDSNNSRQDIYEDCGSDYCGSWGSTYCSGNSVYKERTCYDKGCSSGSCFNNSNTEKSLVRTCNSNETCSNGQCIEQQQCTSGPCCDGRNYKSSSSVCKNESETKYSCAWGDGCGADVGQSTRIRFQYCSGNSNQCDGNWGSWGSWSSWIVADYCSTNETCSNGDSTCNYNSTCSTTPITQVRQCYDNDVYWYNNSGDRLSKYMECSDTNSCTLDSCDGNKCSNNLKCDGTTCSKDSTDYCSSCQHCGDGIANCDETFCACPVDVKLPAANTVAISVLANKTGINEGWKKNISVSPGDKLSFLIIVASSSNDLVSDVSIENLLPANISYLGNLKVDDSPFVGNIAAGLNLGTLASKQSKYISFDAKVGNATEFTTGTTYLSNLSTVNYSGDKTTSDSVNLEILNGIQGTAAAGSIFSQILKVIGSLAFWLVILFILILTGILSFAGYYWVKKKREAELVRL